MGGSLATCIAQRAKIPKIKALITIDCVGEARYSTEQLDSLAIRQHDVKFKSVADACTWYQQESTFITKKMAEISITPRLKKSGAMNEFILPIKSTQKYWNGWFEDHSEKFLSVSAYKMALFAGHGEGNFWG